MNNNRLNILTFLSISLTILVFGFIGVNYSVKTIRKQYIEIQLESNRRMAETIAKLFEEKLEKGSSKSELIKSFQSSIEGTNTDEGYLCMFDQKDGVLLCHPDTNAIGKSINSDKLQFLNMRGGQNELLVDAVSTEKKEYGILKISEPVRSEIAYMIPVPGTSWKISVHENLDKAEKMLSQLRWVAFSGFILLSLLISLISTWIVRKLNRKHEKEIESKNYALEQSNNKLIGLNFQIKEQHSIISKHAENLELEVRKRTAELESIYSKLTDLEKSKSDFLLIISHELRTPLNGIIGLSSLLEDELKNTEHHDFIQDIRLSGERLFKFAETALLVTQLKVQSDQIEYQPISIQESIVELWEIFIRNTNKKNLRIIFSEPMQDNIIYGVPKMIKRCFGNILENAFQHSPVDGQIFINSFQDANQLFITVRDNGEGFSEEAFLRQFDLFSADKAMHHSEGFGLGLAAARLIVNAHSGDIQISNHPDGGGMVTLKFPLKRA